MNTRLLQTVGLPGALVIGLGSILGTGVYVSIGLSYQLAAGGLLTAIAMAAMTALFNGLSAAQLAASHPVSGGTYEYGYHYLSPSAGFVAGSLFVLAKSASAATAAAAVGWAIANWLGAGPIVAKVTGCLLLIGITAIILQGVRRSNIINALLVTISLAGLAGFVVWGLTTTDRTATPVVLNSSTVIEAAALMFVAFTGYGRIATMGEEVKQPNRTIPQAIVITLAVTALIYMLVGYALMQLIPPQQIDAARFNLAQAVNAPAIGTLVAVCAVAAMISVVLNLVLGVSRVILAMGRRADLPAATARLNASANSAPVASWVACLIMVVIVLLTDVKQAWTLSAFTVLVYYSITNLAALKVPLGQRFIPRWVSVLGLLSCLGLSIFVPTLLLLYGFTAIAVLFAGHRYWRASRSST